MDSDDQVSPEEEAKWRDRNDKLIKVHVALGNFLDDQIERGAINLPDLGPIYGAGNDFLFRQAPSQHGLAKLGPLGYVLLRQMLQVMVDKAIELHPEWKVPLAEAIPELGRTRD